MTEQTEIKVGQLWEEVDPRNTIPRRVQIAVISEPMKRQVRDRKGKPQFVEYREVKLWTGAKFTKARSDRFNGKRGGYRLLEDV